METGDLHGSFLPYDVLGRIARQACPDSLALWGFNLRSRGRTSATRLTEECPHRLAGSRRGRAFLSLLPRRGLARRLGASSRAQLRRNRRRLPPDATGFAVPITKSVTAG